MKLIHILALYSATTVYALPQGLPILGSLGGAAGDLPGDADSASLPTSASISGKHHPAAAPKHEPTRHAVADKATSLSSAAPVSSQAPGLPELPLVGGIVRRTMNDATETFSAAASSSKSPGLPELPLVGGILARKVDSAAPAASSDAPGLPELPIVGGILARSADLVDDATKAASAAPVSSSDAPGLPELPVVGGILARQIDKENHVTKTRSATSTESSNTPDQPELPVIGGILARAANDAAPTKARAASVPMESAVAPVAEDHVPHWHNDPALRLHEAPPAEHATATPSIESKIAPRQIPSLPSNLPVVGELSGLTGGL